MRPDEHRVSGEFLIRIMVTSARIFGLLCLAIVLFGHPKHSLETFYLWSGRLLGSGVMADLAIMGTLTLHASWFSSDRSILGVMVHWCVALFYLYFKGIGWTAAVAFLHDEKKIFHFRNDLIHEAGLLSEGQYKKALAMIEEDRLIPASSFIRRKMKRRVEILDTKARIAAEAEKVSLDVSDLLAKGDTETAERRIVWAKKMLSEAERFGVERQIRFLLEMRETFEAEKIISEKRGEETLAQMIQAYAKRIQSLDLPDRKDSERLLSRLSTTRYGSREYRMVLYELGNALARAETKLVPV